MATTALMEITAVSSQDEYMTPLAAGVESSIVSYSDLLNPFYAEYLPTIKFAKTSIQASHNGTVDFGGQATVALERLGIDLALGVTLEVVLPELQMINVEADPGNDPSYLNKVRWCPNPGHNIVDETWIVIGGAEIERQSSTWWDIKTNFKFSNENSKEAYNVLIGQQNLMTLKIGTDDITQVPYLRADDIEVLGLAGISDAAVGALPAETLVWVVTIPNHDPTINGVDDPTAGTPATDTYTAESVGPYNTEGIVTQGYNGLQTYKTHHPETKINIIYKFWFCDKPHLALPIISISLQSIEIHTKFRKFSQCIQYKNLPLYESDATARIVDTQGRRLTSPLFYITSIYVDPQTRELYTNLRTQLMIQLVDCVAPVSLARETNKTVEINTNHPSDELIWVIQDTRSRNEYVSEYTNYYMHETNNDIIPSRQPLVSAQLLFQTQSRTELRGWEYFRYFTHLQAHRNPTKLNVYLYSFSLEPENYQIYGTANFSRIDKVSLKLVLNPGYSTENARLYVFNSHRNFFRIASSQGGKIFAS